MRKHWIVLLLFLALTGCSAADLVPAGQPPAAKPPEAAPPAASPMQPPTAQPVPLPTKPAPLPVQPAPEPAQPPSALPTPPAPTQPASPPPQNHGSATLTSLRPDVVPEPGRTWLYTHHDEPAFAVFRVGNDLYLLAAVGERNTGGYSARITGFTQTNGMLQVTVDEKAPGPGEMVAQVITWPVAAARISNAPDLPVSISFGSGTYKPASL